MNHWLKFGIAGAVVAAVIVTSIPTLGIVNNCEPISALGSESEVIRVGYFANVNHAQAVIGLGRGDYQRSLEGVEVKTQVFNAGPSVIEAMLANQIDVAYIGPNPAINGYSVDCRMLRVISGAASGGAVFVVRNDAGIQSVADFAGKKFSSPQLGNTQDVALKKYLIENGYTIKTIDEAGNVEVLPAKNADIVTLMVKKEIDGAWVPEPWGAKLVKEANSKIFLDERTLWPNGEFVAAHIVVRTEYLRDNPETIKNLLNAHIDETEWINENKVEAVKAFNQELKKLTGNEIPADQLVEGLSRMELTYDPVKESLFQSAEDAIEIGFIKAGPDLAGIYDLRPLNEVLAQRGLEVID